MTLKKLILPIVLILAAIGGYFYFNPAAEADQEAILTALVEEGEFIIKVIATGELNAKNSEKIRGPKGMRNARIYQTTITDLVPEGTVVKEGDYVATLDRTELDTKLKEAQTEIDKIDTQMEQAQIDTAIEMRGMRDQLINMKFSTKEKELEVKQSKYEAPMVIQQAEIELQRIQRDYNQLESKYQLTREKSEAKISEIMTTLTQTTRKKDQLAELSDDFIIKAPKDGMVIYARGWGGKTGPGSQISTWDPVVAELPDLTDMVSKTYINEVDISRVKKGQEVEMEVDAFPDLKYSGKVIQVANIGEELRNYDSKVFEVVVQLNETDSILRPAMTTSNNITTDILQDKIFIPLEALYSDSLSFVYKQNNSSVVKQEVITSLSNDEAIIIQHGLAKGDEVLLGTPSNANDLALVKLDPKIKEEIMKKQAEEMAARQAETERKMKSVKNEKISSESGGGGGMIIFR